VTEEFGYKNVMVFDPQERFVVGGGFGGAVYAPLDGGEAKHLPGFKADAFAIAVNHDRTLIAAGGGFEGGEQERFVRIWDVASWERRDLRMGMEITGMEFTAADELIFAAGGNLFRWDRIAEKPELLAEGIAGGDRIYGRIDLSPDGRYVLSNLGIGSVRIHDLQDGTTRAIMSHGYVYQAVFDPTGTIIVSAGDDGIVRVGPVSGEEPHWLVGHQGMVNEVAVSPDGQWIASVGSDGAVRLWPMPDLSQPPMHALPYEEFMERVRAQTNLKLFEDDRFPTGYNRGGTEPPDIENWDDVPEW